MVRAGAGWKAPCNVYVNASSRRLFAFLLHELYIKSIYYLFIYLYLEAFLCNQTALYNGNLRTAYLKCVRTTNYNDF